MNYSLKSIIFNGSKSVRLCFGTGQASGSLSSLNQNTDEVVMFDVDVGKCKDVTVTPGETFAFKAMLKLSQNPGWTLVDQDA